MDKINITWGQWEAAKIEAEAYQKGKTEIICKNKRKDI